MKGLSLFALSVLLGTACVPKGKYDELEGIKNQLQLDLEHSQSEHSQTQQELARLGSELSAAEAALLQTNRKLAEKISEAGELQADMAGMKRALAEAEVRKARADAALKNYRDLTARFQALIDAGTLQVKVIDGRMVVELATDILFGAGSASLSRAGRKSIEEVARVLASIPDRKYQVAGHTDNVPIATEKFPSNWHLGAARAISVTQLLVRSGLDGSRVSAASSAEFQPTDTNRTREGKAANRRIEIIIVPDLSDLPGFDELQALADDG